MIFIASMNSQEPVLTKQIAGALSIPKEFLNKVMQLLVKSGFLISVRGPGGGFILAKDPKDITIFDIVKAIDGTDWFETCILRVGPCNVDDPCALHDYWIKLRNQVRALLDHESLADMVKELRNGKKVLQFAEDFILLKKIKTQMGIN